MGENKMMIIADVSYKNRKFCRTVSGLIGDNEVSHIEFFVRGRNLHILVIETDKHHRCNGYASALIEYVIKTYGRNYHIKLKCMPFGIEVDKNFKDKQEKLAKFYEGFGFTTEDREEYSDCYQWYMIRNKK